MKPSSIRDVHGTLFGFHDQLTLVSYVPKPAKSVIVISSMRHDKAVEGDQKKPQIILHYNATKSSVDNMDHLTTLYISRRKTNRWPLVLFFNTLDTEAIATCILWLTTNPDWKLSEGKRRRGIFLRELGYSLVRPHMITRSIVATLQSSIR